MQIAQGDEPGGLGWLFSRAVAARLGPRAQPSERRKEQLEEAAPGRAAQQAPTHRRPTHRPLTAACTCRPPHCSPHAGVDHDGGRAGQCVCSRLGQL